MAEEQVKYFTLKLNYLQFETVRNLFNHSGWDFEECLVGPNKSFEASPSNESIQRENNISEPPNEQVCGSHDGSKGDDADDEQNGEQNGGNEFVNDVNQGSECLHCFLAPCITENRQLWLAQQPLDPHVRNSGLRKLKYKQFWKMMDREGAWKLQKYIRKKSTHLGDDGSVWTLREIMPFCVVHLVRSLYPNPQGQPYMGHKWW